MAERDDGRVLVAGAGIAGLAVVRALHRRGLPAMIVERRPDPLDAGLALNLPGNAIAALNGLGLADEVRGLGSPIGRREYRTSRGRLLFAIDEDRFWGAEARPRCIRRADLLRLLGRDLPPGSVRRGREVTAVRERPSDVWLRLSDGGEETGGFLVGADGVRSTVRRLLWGGEGLGTPKLGEASWRFMVPDPGVGCWTVWAGAGALFLLIPVDRGEAYGWASAPGAPSDLRASRGRFNGFPAPVLRALEAALDRPDAVHHSPLEDIRIPSWSRPRAALIGDAAHAMAPVWAQGAALALEDALVLADLLAEQRDWSSVGAEYDRRRRARVAHVQGATDRMSKAARMPGPLRDALMPFVGPRSYRAVYGTLRDAAGF